MKKKYIDGTDLEWLEKYTSKQKYIDDEYRGYVSLIEFEKVKFKMTVDYDSSETCLLDDGYKGIIYMPLDKTWCVSTVFNRENEIVEWYFDMTKENSVEENGKPFFIDLYLDIAVSADRKITVLDEDELQEALDQGIINEQDFEMAKVTCRELIAEVIPDDGFMEAFFYRHLEELS